MQISQSPNTPSTKNGSLARLGAAVAIFAAAALAGGSAALADSSARLTIADGVVVKFGAGAGIQVRDQLHTGAGVIFTSQFDDATIGPVGLADPADPTNTQAPTAQPGDWLGVLVAPEVPATALKINDLAIRYGGGTSGLPSHLDGGAGLVISGAAYRFERLQLSSNAVGLRVIGSASPGTGPSILQSRITHNGTGLLAEQGATPAIAESDISGNSQFGVRNTNPATVVQAQGNWWGHASGPQDAAANPTGLGNPVSAGVAWGSHLTAQPVLACTMVPTQGYASRTRSVQLSLDCPQAVQYRIQETALFDDALAWQSMAGNPTIASYTVSAQAGDKMLHVQFRTAQNSTNQFALSQPIAYAPEGPLVQFTQPAANAVLDQDTAIAVTASDAEGLRDVEILVDGTRLALLTQAPYQALWPLAGVANGNHTLKAVATNSAGLSNAATRTVQVQKQGASGPAITAVFAGQPLVAGSTPPIAITEPGLLAVSAQSAVGISRIQAAVDGVSIFDRTWGNASPVNYSQFMDFALLPNGEHSLRITASDADGQTAVLDIAFSLSLSAPPAPTITQPTAGASVWLPQLNVAGTAMPGAQVQLFLNGQATGAPIAVGTNGSFGGTLTLAGEGVHQLEASASNARGTSAKSAALAITYTSAAPSLSFVAPGPDATLSGSTTVSVLAAAPGGIAKVDIYANARLLASPTQAPYSASWDTSGDADGVYTLKAIATSASGKTAEAAEQVHVQNAATTPALPQPPYSGTVSSISPAVSYGSQPIVITGSAVAQGGAQGGTQSIANAALRMVLDVAGYKRRINLATDAQGQYRYEFVPGANDNGTYLVSVIHPSQSDSDTAEQGRFTINRLSFEPSHYRLSAARGFASPITINACASAGTGATGVHWQAVPAHQSAGSLPPGISVDVGQGIDLAPGACAPMVVKLTGSASAGQAGTVILTAFAEGSADSPRGQITIDYQLVQAGPQLFAQPTFIETGVQQGSTVTESTTIGNRGLVAAEGVQIKLVDNSGNPPPPWIFLASGQHIGAIDVGGQVPVQITASPTTDVADGIYNYKLVVSANNSGEGTIPVSVAVTQSGQGGVRFHVTDLFTQTLNKQGQPILGVQGARIRLQNDAVLTYLRDISTDADGQAQITDLPPGTYSWRASGPRHADKTGRLFVRAGITAQQPIHLQYQTISIDFSVTETSVEDVYDINLEATFQTQVPAPVVLLEPLSINLPELQVGEEFTGELTLTNYGLIRADQVKFSPPQSDEYYQYEFLADIPQALEAKQRIVIPYRVTAIKLHPRMMGFTKTRNQDWASLVQKSVGEIGRTKAGNCSSYAKWTVVTGEWICVNGEMEDFTSTSTFSRLVGGSCASVGGGGGGDAGGWGGGWGGGSYSGGGTPLPLAPECTPICRGECCAREGSGPGGGGSGGSGGPSNGGGSNSAR